MKVKTLQRQLKDPFIISLLVVLLVGIFLRFFRFEGFVTFLGDQGRDALIMKRIVTLEHIPGVGAPSSIGHVFLGPFYYYLMAPWILLSGLNPIGPAIGVGIFSTLFIAISYFVALDLFRKKTIALFMATAVAFSYILIWLSRFSWNPNLLPLFALLAVYTFIKAFEESKLKYFVLSGLFFSFCIQFHYVALASGLCVVGYMLWYLYKTRDLIMKSLINIFAMISSFIVGILPLIVFDIRNDFINFKSFLGIFSEDQLVSSSRGIMEIFHTFAAFNDHALHISAPTIIHALFFIIVILATPRLIKGKKNYIHILVFFWITLFFTSYFTNNKHQHYFGFLYPLYYLILVGILDSVISKKYLWLWAVPVIAFIVFQSQDYTFLRKPGSYQIRIAEKIAREIEKHITNDSYYLTSLPESVGDSTERYFLEIWGKKSQEKYTTERSEELFVLCEELCSPVGNGQFDIALFAPKKVVGTWRVENVTIYKLIR